MHPPLKGALGVVHSLVPFLLHERNEQKSLFATFSAPEKVRNSYENGVLGQAKRAELEQVMLVARKAQPCNTQGKTLLRKKKDKMVVKKNPFFFGTFSYESSFSSRN